MKQLVSIFVFLLCFIWYTQAQTDSIVILLAKLNSNTITDTERKVLKAKAFDFQNRGQMLGERKHDFKGSLILTDSAIMLFNSMADTLNIANNKKFKGYLLGRLGKYEPGKSEISEAMYLFALKNASWGVAVSQFDLAWVYNFEGRLDSALFYCNLAIGYWKTKGNHDRIFVNQNLLIDLLTKSKDLEKARLIQKESALISENNKQHEQVLLDFYVVSGNLFKAAEQFETADNYGDLYLKLVKELKTNGITGHSSFDSQ